MLRVKCDKAQSLVLYWCWQHMTCMADDAALAHLQDVSELAVAVWDVGVSPDALSEGFDYLRSKPGEIHYQL